MRRHLLDGIVVRRSDALLAWVRHGLFATITWVTCRRLLARGATVILLHRRGSLMPYLNRIDLATTEPAGGSVEAELSSIASVLQERRTAVQEARLVEVRHTNVPAFESNAISQP